VSPVTGGSAASGCVVWLASTEQFRNSHIGILSESEMRRREAYVREPDRVRFTLGAALLRLAAARELAVEPTRVPIDRACPECGKPHGKPRLPGTGLHVSVSHSEQVVGVAVTSLAEVGVDVEAVGTGEVVETLRHTCLDPEEPVRERADFYTYWCRKESVVKATGDGLRIPLTKVRVSPANEPARLVSYAGSVLTAVVADIDVGPGYRGAVTVLTGDDLAVDVRGAEALLDG